MPRANSAGGISPRSMAASAISQLADRPASAMRMDWTTPKTDSPLSVGWSFRPLRAM